MIHCPLRRAARVAMRRPAVADAAFSVLHDVAMRLRADHPDACVMSAGMTGDLEQAIAAGATHLRVGTALFGRRPPPLR